MRRRQPDGRPPIEIVGAEPGLSSLQHVSTGPPGGGGRGRRGLVVAACVVALVVLGLALGGDDEGGREAASGAEEEGGDRTATTRRRGPTTTRPRPTTTTTTLPTGPVFGEPLGGSLLVFAGSTWTLVDIDSGARRELELAGRDVYATQVVRGGVVSLSSDREARYFDLRSGTDVAPVELGVADQVLSHPQADRVWLLDLGGPRYEGSTPEVADARLVDLDGNVLRSISVPGGYVSAATDEGLLFERGGRVFVVDEAGVRPFAVGYVIGAVERSAVLYTCDDAAQCRVELRSPEDRAGRRLDSPPESFDFGHEVAPRPGGGFALVRFGGNSGDGSIAFYDASGASLGTIDQTPELYFGRPYWLPGDAGLVAATGGRPTWIHRQDGEWITEDVEPLGDLAAEAVYVIEP